MEKKSLTLIIVSIVFVVLIGTISLFLDIDAIENKVTLINQEKCIELEEEKGVEINENAKLLEKEEALKLADELYKKGISAHTCGGVDLNYDNVKVIDDYEYYEVTNWLELRSVFTQSAKVKGQLGLENYYSIDEMVTEKSGKYYDMDCSRGSHMGYRGTDFEIVSINSDIIVYDANSKYCTEDSDYEENCETYIVSELFVIEKEDNNWKINRMVYPNN